MACSLKGLCVPRCAIKTAPFDLKREGSALNVVSVIGDQKPLRAYRLVALCLGFLMCLE